MPLTDKQIEELRELYEQTTPGGWNYDDDSENVVSSEFHNGEHLQWTVVESPVLPVGARDNCQISNGLFIAAAHNAMPAIFETLAEREGLIVDLNESRRERFNLNQDNKALLATLAERDAQIAAYTRRVNESQNEAGETTAEPEDIILALRAELQQKEAEIKRLQETGRCDLACEVRRQIRPSRRATASKREGGGIGRCSGSCLPLVRNTYIPNRARTK